MGESTPAETLERWRQEGMYDPDCPGCEEYAEAVRQGRQPYQVFTPSHLASEYCESGGYNHCTCPGCWG